MQRGANNRNNRKAIIMAPRKPKNEGEGQAYQPMATGPITVEDRIEALEARVKVAEDAIKHHEIYHFGKRE